MAKVPRLRDRSGKFCKRPTVPPLDPEMLASLRKGPLTHIDWSRIPIALELIETTRPAVPLWKVTWRDANPA